MVGRVLAAGGTPVSGIRVSTVEGEAVTDAEGAFAVTWKAPQQHVLLKVGSLAVERGYSPADAGKVLELRLPELRDATLRCPEAACQFAARWPLSEGFEGVLRHRCAPGVEQAVAQVPVGTPVMSCTEGHGAEQRLVPLEGFGL